MISILDLIESNPKKTAYGYEIIGTIIDEVNPPHPIPTLVLLEQDTCFAMMDVVAIVGKGGVQKWTRGYVMVVVPREVVRDAKTKPSKRLAVGVSGGRLQYALKNDSIVSMYQLKQADIEGKKLWGLEPLKVRTLTKSTDSSVIKLLTRAVASNWEYTYPEPTPQGFLVSSSTVEMQTPSGYYIKAGMYSNIPLSEPVDMDTVLTYATTQTKEKEHNYQSGGLQSSFGQPAPPTHQTHQPQGDTPEVKGLFTDGFGLGQSQGAGVNAFGVVEETKTDTADTKTGSRFEPVPIKQEVKVIQQQIKEGLEKRGAIISTLEGADKQIKVRDMMITNIIEGFKNNWSTPILYKTGKEIFLKVLENFELPNIPTQQLDTILTVQYKKLVEALNTGVMELDDTVSDEVKDLHTLVYGNREVFLFGVIEFALGIKNDRLLKTYFKFKGNGLSFFDTISKSPFTLGYINSSLLLEDIEKLRRLFNLPIKEEAKNMRDVAYVKSILTNENNIYINSSTIVEENKLKRLLVSGIPLTKDTTPAIRGEGRYINEEQENFIQSYIHKAIKKDFFNVTDEQLQLKGREYVLTDGRVAEQVLENYLLAGQGVRINHKGRNYIADLEYISKEIELMHKFDEMNKQVRDDISEKDLLKCIQDFEAMKTKDLGFEFKLEDAQKDVLKLIKYRALILTGIAGSGKTTVAELLLFALKRFYGMEEDKILFVAPTGKAAVRLQETVKAPTATIHSVFGIGVGDDNIRWQQETQMEGVDAVLGDEYSMVNIDVAYESIMQLDNGVTLIFLGDIAQLPPIGFGKPLYDFMQYLPCVRLNVSKRASENSLITRNASKLLDRTGRGDLESGEDFVIEETTDTRHAINYMKQVLKYHVYGVQGPSNVSNKLGVIDVDDIQVITPYSGSSDYNTKILNREIQEIVNPYTSKSVHVTINKEDYEFRIKDRVMHIRVNIKEMPHYVEVRKNVFKTATKKGIFNGDVGKVKAYYKADAIQGATSADILSINELLGVLTDKDMVVAVEYETADDKGKLIKTLVFYKTTIITDNGRHFVTQIKDMANLQHAYASTVHKLQGSQSKLTINLLPTSKISPFITSNLLYTGVTRTEEVCYFVGGVYGYKSAVNQARKVDALDKRDTVIGLIYS